MNASTPLTILALAGILAARPPASAQTAAQAVEDAAAAKAAGNVSAQVAEEAVPMAMSVNATASYVSAYVYRGRELAGASFQPSVEADFSRWALGVWASTPFTGSSGERFSEIDPYATYTLPLGAGFSVVPGAEIYTYPQTSEAVGSYNARFEPNLSLSYNAHGVKLTPTAYYDVTLRELTLEFTAMAALPLPSIGSELDFTAMAGNYTAEKALHGGPQREKIWGSYWLLGASVPYQLGRHVRASIGYAYTDGADAREQFGDLPSLGNPQAGARGVFTVSVSYRF